MESNQTRCYRCVGDIRKMIKYGKTKSGSQRYICRACGKTRVKNYASDGKAFKEAKNDQTWVLVFGLGVAGLGYTGLSLRVETLTKSQRLSKMQNKVRI